jgi:aspartate/methionine/tyrosine aminotransferase
MLALTDRHVRFDLAESVGPDLLLRELLADGPGESLADLALSYGTAPGDGDLRALIAQAHGATAEEVVVTAGSIHALFLLALILGGPGVEMVIGTPVFPGARATLDAAGSVVRPLPFSFQTGYRLDPGALEQVLTPATRLVSLATPQNPSGVALTDGEITQVLEAMDRICPDAVLLLDETYREATLGEAPIRPTALGRDPRIVVCGSLSKCHGAPGLRVGWVLTRNVALRTQLLLGKFHTVISLSQVDEALAIRVLRSREAILAARRPRLTAGLELTRAMVTGNRDLVDWVEPDGGALCCLRMRKSDPAALHANLARRNTRVGAGRWFGEDDRVFRLGFGLLPPAALEEALAHLAQALGETARA